MFQDRSSSKICVHGTFAKIPGCVGTNGDWNMILLRILGMNTAIAAITKIHAFFRAANALKDRKNQRFFLDESSMVLAK